MSTPSPQPSPARQVPADGGGFAVALFHAGTEALSWLADAAAWTGAHLVWLLAGALPLAVIWAIVHRRLTAKALADRTRYILTPSADFEPAEEHLWRYAATILRTAKSGPWWAPRAGRGARIRFRADGSTPLEMSVEGPSSAKHLLKTSQYPGVSIAKAPALKDRPRTHTVRAEFVLRGHASKALRNVPMNPDPLQGIVDAVADISTEAGDLAELCLDVQAVPRWKLRLKRWQVFHEAREKRRAWAKREARQAAADAAELADSWQQQLSQLLEPGPSLPRRPAAAPVRGKPVDRAEALGRLAMTDRALLRVQLLVRCSSDLEGRAEERMARLAAALDVFGGGNVWSEDARGFAKWRITANSRYRWKAFDERWRTAKVEPRKQNWVHVGELHGLIKPVTVHCSLPVIASELPTYEEIGQMLVPHGIHTGPDGRRRIVATPEEEFFFSVAVGRSRYGKTEQAEVRALAVATAGRGVAFVDPHGGSWGHVAPYLAHESLRNRVWRVDLTGRTGRVPTWNPMSMERGQEAHDVSRAVSDSLASAMKWDDGSAPRGLTILMKAVEALVAFNAQAVRQQLPQAQATIFQIPPLLEDPDFRALILAGLPAAQRRWWQTTFKTLDPGAFAVIINPITRLAAQPVALAFLGSPVSGYDARTAMDKGKLVWICPAGVGPTDNLLNALIVNDLFRAGRSREDLPERARRPFHMFADELISLDKATGGVLASISEQLGKFGIRLHAMSQLLQRVSQNTRDALLQNASALSSTAGSASAIQLVAAEWHGKVDAAKIASLPKYHYYATMTSGGRIVGPMRLEGMQVEKVFRKLFSPKDVPTLQRLAADAVGSKHRDLLVRQAGYQHGIVAHFGATGQMPTGADLKAIKIAADGEPRAVKATTASGASAAVVLTKGQVPPPAGAPASTPVSAAAGPSGADDEDWGEAPPEDEDPHEALPATPDPGDGPAEPPVDASVS